MCDICPLHVSGTTVTIAVAMKEIGQVKAELLAGNFSFTLHAFERAVERNISEREIREAGAGALVIESYPDDKYGPSCLLLGFTHTGRPLHIQVSLAETPDLRVVTIYEPDPYEWVGYAVRR